MRTESLTTLALGLALVGAATAWSETAINETRPAAPNAVVEVENLAGSVEVVGWTKPELEVTGTLARGAERCEVSGDQNHLKVRVVLPRNAREVDGSVLKLQLPAGARLEVEGVSVDISVAGVTGRIELESVSGDLTVTGRPAGLEGSTVSGTIEVELAPSGSKLESVSGNVTVTSASGGLEASSVSGDVVVKGGSLDRAEVSSTSGSIRCAADLSGTGPIELESMSGEVSLEVPAKVVADFELSTFSGDISSALGPQPQRTSEYAPGEELKFSTGPGGPKVTASSFSGSVTLKTR
jgi:hypothetical protein